MRISPFIGTNLVMIRHKTNDVPGDGVKRHSLKSQAGVLSPMVDNAISHNYLRHDSEYLKFQGKSIVIMGDPAGIGRATAGLMTEYGARVFFAARNPAELSSALAEVEQEGGQWDGMVINVVRLEDAWRLINLAWQRMGKIDLLIIPPADRNDDGSQYLYIHEAIQHFNSEVRITTIEVPELKSITARTSDPALQRETSGPGIMVTLIEPGLAGYRDFKTVGSSTPSQLVSKDIAEMIFNSLLLRFGSDLVLKNG
jgi:hypothetical protein